MLIILGIVVVLFGATRLPQLGRALNRGFGGAAELPGEASCAEDREASSERKG